MANHNQTCLRLIAAVSVAGAALVDAPVRAQPAEESRLSTAVFRAGLQKRGLTALLELHVKDFPPASEIEASLMLREIKLAEAVDPASSAGMRSAAVAEANRILQRLIAQRRLDPRRFEWQFELAHSLLHDEAEPQLNALLYKNGHAPDVDQLLTLTSTAVVALKQMLNGLQAEYDRIDGLSIGQFERLESEGYLNRLDALAPRAEYLLLWALLYDAVPRTDADPVRATRLHEVLDRMRDNPALTRTAHETSQVQIQAMLLLGMAHRLLNQHRRARQHLEQALTAADRIDEAELRRIDWAITLTWLELIRNAADDHRFDAALRRLKQFRGTIDHDRADALGRQLMAALMERSVLRLRADHALAVGNESDARQYRHRAWQAVAKLANQDRRHRDEVYAALYDMMGSTAPAELDPLEQCALIAGLLSEADGGDQAMDTRLARAVAIGESFLSTHADRAAVLVPEVLYNMGAAEFRRGRMAAAIERFLEVARDHASFEDSASAGIYAVQLASQMYGDPRLRSHPGVSQVYRDALELLLVRQGDSEASRYWRFYYAQLLDESGEFKSAAAQYAQVDATHEHFHESLFYRARCLALVLQEQSTHRADPGIANKAEVESFLRVQREFTTRAAAVTAAAEPARRVALAGLLAESTLLTAEVYVLPGVERAQQALATLTGFEARFPEQDGLAARLWRVRLLAYEQLNRLDEAELAIPRYMAADAEGAGATLQGLYLDLAEDAEELLADGDTKTAQMRAELALVLAREIQTWSAERDWPASARDRDALTIQLAEANLRAGRPARARELFELLASDLASQAGPLQPSDDSRVLMGLAQSLYQMGDFAGALPMFNRLAMGLPPSRPDRWQALLRDLQCRTSLDHAPEDIIRVIQQQKRLFPKLGGPTHAAAFERLLRSNERRRDREPAD